MREPIEFKVGAIPELNARFKPEVNQLPSGQAQVINANAPFKFLRILTCLAAAVGGNFRASILVASQDRSNGHP